MVLKQLLTNTMPDSKFENDVEMYGAQTFLIRQIKREKFENDVEMYGAQTSKSWQQVHLRLRMM